MLHLAMGYVIVVSGLGVPTSMVAAMVLAWGLLAGQFIAITRRGRNPWWYLAVPGSAAAMWLLILLVGGAILDWTA